MRVARGAWPLSDQDEPPLLPGVHGQETLKVKGYCLN